MAPSLATAQTSLNYPLYSLDFVGDDGKYILVGGGGGPGRSGVGNKIVSLR
jgi:hypothetical protein